MFPAPDAPAGASNSSGAVPAKARISNWKRVTPRVVSLYRPSWCTDLFRQRARACGAGAQLHCNRSLIHLAFGELRQLSIGLLFLFEALVQKPLVIAQVQLTGQTGNHAIRSDLVMLNFLC